MKLFYLGLVIATGLTLPAVGQQAVPDGIYQLNYEKSTIHGPTAKSQTLNRMGDTVTVVGFDANGKPYTVVFPSIADGRPRPITGSPAFDTQIITQLNPYTTSISRTKDGKVTQTGIAIHNPATNTTTLALTSPDASASYVLVFEKQ
jgi:hypothetical protein